jgi:hypothetical protein
MPFDEMTVEKQKPFSPVKLDHVFVFFCCEYRSSSDIPAESIVASLSDRKLCPRMQIFFCGFLLREV